MNPDVVFVVLSAVLFVLMFAAIWALELNVALDRAFGAPPAASP